MVEHTKILHVVPTAAVAAVVMVASGAEFSFAADSTESNLSSPISTSRPSFSAPSTTLQRGQWQLEGGYQYTSDDGSGIDSDAHTLPFLLVRTGVSNRLELDLFWTGYSDVDTNVGDIDGASDLSVGLSYQLMPDDSKLGMSVFGALSLPVGSDDFSSDEVDPGAGLAWSYALDAGPGLFGTVVANSVTSGDERETQLGTAVGLAHALSERIGSYVEYFSIHSDSADSAHSIDGGLTYLVNRDVQLDIYAGGGLNDEADDFFIGSGVAWRF